MYYGIFFAWNSAFWVGKAISILEISPTITYTYEQAIVMSLNAVNSCLSFNFMDFSVQSLTAPAASFDY